jgi:predicted nucleic-acid-binding protein
MIGLDTNVLVRYLVRDDKRQAEKASGLHSGSYIQRGLFLYKTVGLCELVWVLEASYGFNKKEIAGVLEKILVTKQFEFEQKEIVRRL